MREDEMPSAEEWSARLAWFDDLSEPKLGGWLVSEHAASMLWDLRLCYAAEAWKACMILSAVVMEAHFRDVEQSDEPLARQIASVGGDPEADWTRQRRNELVHDSSTTVDDIYDRPAEWKADAERAIKAALGVVGMFPFL